MPELDPSAPILLSALLLGLMGSVHCLGMCGGIAAALGQALPEDGAGKGLGRSLLYSVGRISSYAIAGALVGVAGEALARWTGAAVLFRMAAGGLILLFGLHLGGWWNGLAAVERLGLITWSRLAPIARKIGRPDRAWKVFVTGMLWGWLPCGLVYAALLGAAATGSSGSGASFMACFGLGTLPALVAASGAGAQLQRLLAQRSARRSAGALMLVFGVWSMAGPWMPHPASMHGQSHSAEAEHAETLHSGEGAREGMHHPGAGGAPTHSGH